MVSVVFLEVLQRIITVCFGVSVAGAMKDKIDEPDNCMRRAPGQMLRQRLCLCMLLQPVAGAMKQAWIGPAKTVNRLFFVTDEKDAATALRGAGHHLLQQRQQQPA